MSLRVAEEVERYRAFVEHLRSIWATGLRGAVSLEAMSSYTGKNGMLSRDITFFTDEAFEVFSLLYDFEVRRELTRTKAVNFFVSHWNTLHLSIAKRCSRLFSIPLRNHCFEPWRVMIRCLGKRKPGANACSELLGATSSIRWSSR